MDARRPANDLSILVVCLLSSLAAAPLLTTLGWQALNLAAAVAGRGRGRARGLRLYARAASGARAELTRSTNASSWAR